ncbi:hypothetical protein CFP65_0907 [Kitasatospora sp. MMS16-BH015]|uniref:winged helix DNA-binding domain-containing protein n=1 Tax=Kitasatospora sp. MMS16-BH015 TaxID=2018025 RepID=UPI000CA361D8|nr:winged helix DNA-binding domain-containing protein [Kitasatospora sp. MMS16-BH015]AUG75828.1 hypothetical protein CFP65_0907 [Kitasatospora sp. MMS16-BH015]
MQTIEGGQARVWRAAAQGIGGGRRARSVAEVLAGAFAIQAQDATAATLGLRARAPGLAAAEVVRAREEERSFVRGWFMRGTLHLVPAAEARRLTALLGPVFLKLSARRYRELGLGEDELAKGERAVTEALAAEGPLTRAELTARLAGVGLDPAGQGPFHLLRRCALLGLICYGPERAGEPAFVLLDDWLPADPRPFDRATAALDLAGHYLTAHGPAGLADFAAWSGLPPAKARPAWQALTESGAGRPCVLAGQECLLPPGLDRIEAGGDLRLLPAYDNYLLAYRSRDLSVPPGQERQVWPGGGQLRPTVTVDGLARATWARRAGAVEITPFDGLAGDEAAAVEAERADIARFLAGD